MSAQKKNKKTPVAKRKVSRTTPKKNRTLVQTSAARAGEVSKARGPLIPMNDRIVIRHLTEDESGSRNSFGIIIPDTITKEKPEQGVVVAVGPGKWNEDGENRIPMTVSVGDRVVFSKYGYDEVSIGGTEYYIVAEANILAVITH
jgi:chaperonin GroES